MVALFSASDATWSTTPTEQWLAMYEPDIDNLRASLDWAFGLDGDVPLGIELCCYSLRIWDDLALLSERERWFGTAFDRRDAQTPARIVARLCLGRLSNSAHGDRNNFDLAVQASEFFREAGERQGIGDALAKAGAALESPGTTAQAMPYLENALDVLRPAGPSKPLASCLRSLAIAHYFTHDFAGARPLLRQSEAVAKAVGDLRGAAAVQLAGAETRFRGRLDRRGHHHHQRHVVERHMQQAPEGARPDELGPPTCSPPIGSKTRGSSPERPCTKAIALDWRAAVVRLIEHLALIAALFEQTATAARMLGYSVAFYETGAASREHTELATYDRLLASCLRPYRSIASSDSWPRVRSGPGNKPRKRSCCGGVRDLRASTPLSIAWQRAIASAFETAMSKDLKLDGTDQLGRRYHQVPALGGFVYLAIVPNAFSRRVVVYAMGRSRWPVKVRLVIEIILRSAPVLTLQLRPHVHDPLALGSYSAAASSARGR